MSIEFPSLNRRSVGMYGLLKEVEVASGGWSQERALDYFLANTQKLIDFVNAHPDKFPRHLQEMIELARKRPDLMGDTDFTKLPESPIFGWPLLDVNGRAIQDQPNP